MFQDRNYIHNGYCTQEIWRGIKTHPTPGHIPPSNSVYHRHPLWSRAWYKHSWSEKFEILLSENPPCAQISISKETNLYLRGWEIQFMTVRVSTEHDFSNFPFDPLVRVLIFGRICRDLIRFRYKRSLVIPIRFSLDEHKVSDGTPP